MAEFNFGGIQGTSAVNSSKSLKPWGIYNVSFDGLELEDVKGKKDPNAVFKTVKMKFSGEDGVFSPNLFIPSTEEDAKRPEYENKEGHKYEGPSRFETFKWTLLQLAQVVNPEGYKKLQEQSSKIRTMDDFLKLTMTVANAKKGAKTKLKLTGRTTEDGKTYAQLPRIVAINKEGELFVSDNFVGDKVEFSAYEAEKARAYNTAKPTDVEAIVSKDTPDSAAPNEEIKDLDAIDFDSLV